MVWSKSSLLLITVTSLFVSAPGAQRATTATQNLMGEFVSYVARSSRFRALNHGRYHTVIDGINPTGMQFRYFEEDRFPGEHAQIKSRFEWSWVKAIHADGKDSGVLEMKLDRDPGEWSKNGDGKWRPNDEHTQISAIPLPDLQTAVTARNMLARIVSSVGRKVVVN